jgi:hypothetical protein
MNDRLVIDLDDLLTEIRRYLTAVDVFRSVDSEPSWRPESSSDVSRPVAPSIPLRAPSDVELY